MILHSLVVTYWHMRVDTDTRRQNPHEPTETTRPTSGH